MILARALYRRPRLLALDEATSHLDVGNEQLVNAAIRRLDVTRVIVAHRPETIASADRVLVLHGGQIVQDVRPQAAATTVPGAAVMAAQGLIPQHQHLTALLAFQHGGGGGVGADGVALCGKVGGEDAGFEGFGDGCFDALRFCFQPQ